ncbi:MAG: ABC transporter substrate-binding protein [Ruminococcaceae bacterium]|nr:ABC transporter substrate-binding protein [Oscillospiraceae bacterium]
MKKVLSILLTVCILIGVSACGNQRQAEPVDEFGLTAYENHHEKSVSGGMLRLALTGAKSLNPALATSENNRHVLGLVFDGLFKTSVNDAPQPVLCESYSVSPDGLTYEFIIKSNVSFHNGAVLTAQDVAASFELVRASGGVFSGRYSEVASYGAEGMSFAVQLSKPVANFIALMDFPVLSQADFGSIEQALAKATEYVPNGTGRYKVQSYKKSKELYLSVNENYHCSFVPHISDIQVLLLRDRETAVAMLENMQIDLLPSDTVDLSQYTPKRNLSSCEYIDGSFTFVGINNQNRALLTTTTRIALAVSLDRASILSAGSIQHAETADLPIPNHSCWNDASLSTVGYDVAYAKTLLAEDGWQDSDGDGFLDKEVYGERVDLILELLVNEENATRMKLAETVKNHLATAGVVVHVTALPFTEYSERIANQAYDLFIGNVRLSHNYDVSFLFKTDENFLGYSNEEADALLSRISLSGSEEEKQSLFRELCGVLKRDMPMIGLCFEYDLLIFDERLMGGITPSASDIFYGIEHWFLSDK